MNFQKLTVNAWVLYRLIGLLRQFRLDPASVRALQEKRLRRLIDHAYGIPFYRDRFDSAGVKPGDIRTPEDLKRLPLLTKEEYRQFIADAYNRNPDRYAKWFRDGTSGSSGLPLTVYRPWSEQAYIMAKWLRVLILNGYNPLFDSTFCLISPHRVVSRDSVLQRIGLFRRQVLSYLAPPREMAEAYEQWKPDLFYANKSQVVQMAEYAMERGRAFPSPKLYAVGAETMDAASRKIIYAAFGEAPFFESYGCVELGILGFQLKSNKEFFHFCHDTNILELLRDDEANPLSGNAVVTDLHQYAFPLIRYCINDFLETDIVGGQRVLRRVRGRSDDWIMFDDGSRMPFHTFYEIMEHRPEIRKFRVIQETYNLIRIQVVANEGTDATAVENILRADLRRQVRDAGMTYLIDWETDIPPDPNGKLRMIISKVKQRG